AAWQIQLSGTLDTSVSVPTYDIDGFDTPASAVAALRAAGRYAICYINAGSWESWRPDAADYPRRVLGKGNGWPGERWVDVRQTKVLKPILDKRLDMCRSKGFQAVDFDNVDGYVNDTGLALTAGDQLGFNRMIAAEAHAHGLSAGLKNDLDQIPELVGSYDFAVNEQCYEYAECAALRPFTRAGKAVLQIEYSGNPSQICPMSVRSRFSTLFKQMDLGVLRRAC
ncbi:MAG TPA: endo alpha-1,4 polygalactosaminidase, partial [Dermatophilaceae bacterium]